MVINQFENSKFTFEKIKLEKKIKKKEKKGNWGVNSQVNGKHMDFYEPNFYLDVMNSNLNTYLFS